jgi:hypothetical protein
MAEVAERLNVNRRYIKHLLFERRLQERTRYPGIYRTPRGDYMTYVCSWMGSNGGRRSVGETGLEESGFDFSLTQRPFDASSIKSESRKTRSDLRRCIVGPRWT